MHPPTQGSITAPVSNSQPHADQPERQPERDSGHRAGDLELHGWFMLGISVAQEERLPKFGTHHSAQDGLQEPHKWALVSFLRIGTLRRHLTAS